MHFGIPTSLYNPFANHSYFTDQATGLREAHNLFTLTQVTGGPKTKTQVLLSIKPMTLILSLAHPRSPHCRKGHRAWSQLSH